MSDDVKMCRLCWRERNPNGRMPPEVRLRKDPCVLCVNLPRTTKKLKPLSRAQRWANAVTDAKEALEVLVGVQQECQEWYDNLPENLQGSPTGEKLDEIINLDLEGALDTVQEAENTEPPRGFGRD